MQHDLKRLLAYHTVENIGIIFIGLGLALAFKVFGMPSAAALAMTAGLLHVFNHSLFKSLLFFGAGAVLSATGERDMDHLGGLIHNMPRTAFIFLVGCAAISALPPFNGFVSEWLTFQAVLLSPALVVLGAENSGARGRRAAGALGRARRRLLRQGVRHNLPRPPSHGRGQARARDRSPCPGGHVRTCRSMPARRHFPGLFIDALSPAVSAPSAAQMPAQSGIPWLSIAPIAESRSSYNGLLVFLFIAISATLAASVIHRFASDALRRAPAWDCGFPDASPTTQYSAESFAQPIRRVFGSVAFVAREQIDMPGPGETRAARFDLTLGDRIWDEFYVPLIAFVERASLRLNRLQFLTIRQYLSVVFGALVTLLVVLASWP